MKSVLVIGRPGFTGSHLADRPLADRHTEHSLGAGLAHALTRVLRPGPEDWENVALPPSLGWLYYVLRPVRLALKWARRVAPGCSRPPRP